VVSLVRERGLRVVAEGVETAADLEFVREIHCERAQGFLFGRPEPRAQLEGLILAG
jgi:EAL domain-containing protein (putative c-di-GMP-specific phosphodiesterase class I)